MLSNSLIAYRINIVSPCELLDVPPLSKLVLNGEVAVKSKDFNSVDACTLALFLAMDELRVRLEKITGNIYEVDVSHNPKYVMNGVDDDSWNKRSLAKINLINPKTKTLAIASEIVISYDEFRLDSIHMH